jgi:hypothetical protein
MLTPGTSYPVHLGLVTMRLKSVHVTTWKTIFTSFESEEDPPLQFDGEHTNYSRTDPAWLAVITVRVEPWRHHIAFTSCQ